MDTITDGIHMNGDSTEQGDSNDQHQAGLVTRTEFLSTGEVTLHPPGPVTLDDREGVFAHSFKCDPCQLEFALMSWRKSRHRADNTFCPECGSVTEKLHWRACLSDSAEFVTDGTSVEIFNVIPVGREAELINLPKRN